MSKSQKVRILFLPWKVENLPEMYSGNGHIGDTPIFHWSMIMGGYGSSSQKCCPRCHNLPPHITTFHLSEFRSLFHQRSFLGLLGRGGKRQTKRTTPATKATKTTVMSHHLHHFQHMPQANHYLWETMKNQLLQVATTNMATYLFDCHTFQIFPTWNEGSVMSHIPSPSQ